MKVLINAYAVSPDWGSEQGVGWNWIISIARHCELFVITEEEYRDRIEASLGLLPQGHNIHMYYHPVPERVRRMCWNQGDWRFYFHYARWQRQILPLARRIVAEEGIDIIHMLNMVGFREPGFLWKIKGCPYVWGPVAGNEMMPLGYLSEETFLTKVKYRVKNCITHAQLTLSPRVKSAFLSADAVITPMASLAELVAEEYGKKVSVIAETGLTSACDAIALDRPGDSHTLDILWVGRFIRTKKLDIALKALAALPSDYEIKLHIVGFGMNDEDNYYRSLAESLGVSDKCIWHGKLPNDETRKLMSEMDLLFFTSIHEATSTVVPEAIQARLPIVCHDICGFGPLIDDSIGRKIPLVSPEESVKGFAAIISDFYLHRNTLEDMKPNFDKVAESLTYESKGKKVFEIYENLLQH